MRVLLLKLGTGKQERAEDGSSDRRDVRQGRFGSLETLHKRSGPSWGCSQLAGKSEKRGRWGQVQGLAQDELLPPTASLVASLRSAGITAGKRGRERQSFQEGECALIYLLIFT